MLFELIQIEVQCSKNYFKIFLPQEAEVFGNKIKRTAKTTPKIEKIYLPAVSNVSGSFLQKCVNSVEQRLKFSHSESSIIH